jgi:transposase
LCNKKSYFEIKINLLLLNIKAPAPAKSPDLNPIEWVWTDMKRFVRKCFSTNEAECFEAVKEFHKTLTPGYCQNYIRKLKEV